VGHEVVKVSIEPYSNGLGGVNLLNGDSESMKGLKTKSDLINAIKVLYAGKIAEEIMLGECSVGASDDLKKATKILKAYVGTYGMDTDNILSLNYLEREDKKLDWNEKMLRRMQHIGEVIYEDVKNYLEKEEVKKKIWKYSRKLEKEEVIYDFKIEL
jgi:cell division protease FtsH